MKKHFGKTLLVGLMAVLTAVAFFACKDVNDGVNDGEPPAGFVFDKSVQVWAITRESGSGTRDAIHEFLGSSTDNIGSSAERDAFNGLVNTNTALVTVQNTPAVLQSVANNPYQIGYDSLGYCDDTVKKLNYEGVEPTIANVKNNTYKIQRPFVIISAKDRPLASLADNSVEKEFYAFLQSKTAADIVNLGYVFNEGIGGSAAYAAKTLAGQTVKIVGSTSVQPLMDLLAKKFNELTGATVTVMGGGSGVGRQVGTGTLSGDNAGAAFGMASAAIETSHGIDGGLHFQLATDGIAFIVNKANPLNNVTKAQAKQMYAGKRDGEGQFTGSYAWSDFIA
ncbi:MAG: substrate-binding domain-containing protein [Clostridiales bacterium]|jgi:phosphate transport system substrate-binding protein|nr:substrate-binding domain-containing protein [Clostridiales bacterium]